MSDFPVEKMKTDLAKDRNKCRISCTRALENLSDQIKIVSLRQNNKRTRNQSKKPLLQSVRESDENLL